MRISFILLVGVSSLLAITGARAQPAMSDVKPFHPFSGTHGFSTTSEARDVVGRISSSIGLPNIYSVLVSDDAAEVPNAWAAFDTEKNERVVAFNRVFMSDIREAAGGTYWSLMCIAAHELGHHLGDHVGPLRRRIPSHQAELEADYFAGFTLGKMGAGLTDAVSGLRALPFAEGSSSHPARGRRVEEAGRGWRDATQGRAMNANAEPETPQSDSVALARFVTRNNRDIIGNDIQNIPGVSQADCAQTCLSDRACRGYSFDKWNGWCFLKDRIATSVLDPSSVIAVKSSDRADVPDVSQEQAVMLRYRNRVFNDTPNMSSRMRSYEACERSCEDELSCVAFTYEKSSGSCRQFKDTVGYFYDERYDSGVKKQTR